MSDYDERVKLVELASESDRAKLVWLREYMLMGRWSTAYMREANILLDTVEMAHQQLDRDVHPATVIKGLRDGLNKAATVRLEATKPDPLKEEDLKDQRKTFLWMAERDGMDTTTTGSGSFFDRKTQAAWVGFQSGYKLAMQNRNLEARVNGVQPTKPDRKKFLS